MRGMLVKMRIEGDHFLYQPDLSLGAKMLYSWPLATFRNADITPAIGKYFYGGATDPKLIWKIEHVVHDLNPILAAKMTKLPFICGDRVAFYFWVCHHNMHVCCFYVTVCHVCMLHVAGVRALLQSHLPDAECTSMLEVYTCCMHTAINIVCAGLHFGSLRCCMMQSKL